MARRVAVLGAGSWGMAISGLLDAGGVEVTLWEFDAGECKRLQSERGISEKLRDFRLAPSVAVTNSLADAVADQRLLVLAVPSQSLRSALEPLRGRVDARVHFVNLAKGIEAETLLRMSEVVVDVLGVPVARVATLSGPSHAEEVVLDMPTTAVVAGTDEAYVRELQELFSGGSFRVYRSDDLVGVELAGSLKNIVAIATGITDGLGMGDNTRGALMTRGLAEITRLGVTLGANPETFAGLSGVGDLITTCTSRHSRNRYVGEQIGRGRSLSDVLASMHMVAEGVQTTRSGYRLGQKHGVEMPITEQVHQVLFENKPPAEALAELMGRQLKAEIWR